MDLHFVTDFADQAVVLPVAGAVLLGLLAIGWWRAALAWAVVVPATLGAVLLAKMTVFACGTPLRDMGLASPSGHAAAAAMVYGGLVALVLGDWARTRTGLAFAGAAASALVVGYTRLALGVHTLADVLAGGLIGLLGALALVALAGPRPARPRALVGVGAATASAVLLAVLVLFHGQRLHAEMHIGAAAAHTWPFSLCAAAP
jgi:membrane-associated phospholipid phosphatase